MKPLAIFCLSLGCHNAVANECRNVSKKNFEHKKKIKGKCVKNQNCMWLHFDNIKCRGKSGEIIHLRIAHTNTYTHVHL